MVQVETLVRERRRPYNGTLAKVPVLWRPDLALFNCLLQVVHVRTLRRFSKWFDLNDVPPAALLFLACALIFALWGFVDWQRDQRLAEPGLDIRAQVVDRETRLEEE